MADDALTPPLPALPGTIAIDVHFDVPQDRAAIWPVIADTDLLGRAMGDAQAVRAEAETRDDDVRFRIHTRFGGMKVEFLEHPTEFVHERFFRIHRAFPKGAAEWVRIHHALEPVAGGTRVTLSGRMHPRWRALAPVLRLAFGRSLRAMARTYAALGSRVARAEPPVTVPPGAVHAEALRRAVTASERAGAAREVLTALDALIRTSSDPEAARIRPYALADRYGLDRRRTLESCLEATRQGLLDLRWELICPSCRGASTTVPTLAELQDHSSCALCEIRFGIDLEQAVEVAFAPTRAIRAVDPAPFCIAGPARVPHVLAQRILPAGGEASLPVPEAPGTYRLFLRGGETCALHVAPDGAPEARIAAWTEAPVVRPGGAVRVLNPTDTPRHAKLERPRGPSDAASAAEVTALPGFRRHFGADVLKPGLSVSAGRLVFLFSDLTGSTALYADVGDAAAFRLVHEHFELLLPIVTRHGGDVVKTIGDAIMAVFSLDDAAVAAGVDMLRAFQTFRARSPRHAQTHIKLGVFGGPAFAVRANDALDYFGQTVNVAARVQGEAGSGELVIPAARLPELKLPDDIVPSEPYSPALKGVAGPLPLVRLRFAVRSHEV